MAAGAARHLVPSRPAPHRRPISQSGPTAHTQQRQDIISVAVLQLSNATLINISFVDGNMSPSYVTLVCLLPPPINVLPPPFSFVSTSQTVVDNNMSPSYVTLVCLLPPPINVLPPPFSFVSTSQTVVDNNMSPYTLLLSVYSHLPLMSFLLPSPSCLLHRHLLTKPYQRSSSLSTPTSH
ncbi:hypothetical protein J6590_019648 [Homalodisca vitripennis]|nr:hypothetical protein J6590_019648 [Homalodisca vitripennis]